MLQRPGASDGNAKSGVSLDPIGHLVRPIDRGALGKHRWLPNRRHPPAEWHLGRDPRALFCGRQTWDPQEGSSKAVLSTIPMELARRHLSKGTARRRRSPKSVLKCPLVQLRRAAAPQLREAEMHRHKQALTEILYGEDIPLLVLIDRDYMQRTDSICGQEDLHVLVWRTTY